MLGKCLSAEWMKLRRSRIWPVLWTLPAVSVLIGTFNFSVNQGVLKHEWYSLWSQAGLFYGQFFLPVLIAILCAHLCRLEHLNKNWRLLMTAPVSAAGLFWAKWIVAGTLLAFVQMLFAVLYVLAGKWAGLSSGLPPELAGWLIRGWIAALSVAALQLALSVRIRSFAAPVGIGLCAVFAGLGLYVARLGMFFPHSLLTIGMGVLSRTALSGSDFALFAAMNASYVLGFAAVAVRLVRQSGESA